jgi:hypothetical protein
MMNLKAIAVAAALTLAAGGVAVADDSALDALSSASSISIQSVSGPQAANVMPGGVNGDLVDIDSVKARIQNSPQLLGQLELRRHH